MPSILWLRRDLRVNDHPALLAALREGEVIPLFVFDDRILHGRYGSGPRTQFLLESLADLREELAGLGSELVIRRGVPEQILDDLTRATGASSVHATSDVSRFARTRDRRVGALLELRGVTLTLHPGTFAVEDLSSLRNASGQPYTVFTRFYRRWLEVPRRSVLRSPRALPSIPSSLDLGTLPVLAELGLASRVAMPRPGGTRAGHRLLLAFTASVDGYPQTRNDPALATSGLSPYLHFGCISPRELEDALPFSEGGTALRRQLAWRDFFASTLLHNPENDRHEFLPRYRGLRWNDDPDAFDNWCRGGTGFPLVDAGMRQLLREGWMHNRVRMVVGSFLTKTLGMDWRRGERWFMSLLIDGDTALNNGNWQWIASVGADPQPVFKRILNPTRQMERFDPQGRYVRRYVPELANVPDAYICEPWTMPPEVQIASGCRIGRDYPQPMIDLGVARAQALQRLSPAAR